MIENSDVEVVVAVVTRADGRILMIRRKKAEGSLLWAFPGGKVNQSEPEAKASEREVREEAGIRCKAVRKIGQWSHPETHKVIGYWLCRHEAGTAHLTEPEKIDRVEWVLADEVTKRVTSTIFPKLKEELRRSHKLTA